MLRHQIIVRGWILVLAVVSGSWSSATAGARDPDDELTATSKDGDEPESTWDVDAPPGPRLTARIDTDEGTWMALDVRPQGDEIVFDLLGDLYVIPIDGGQARSITSGMSWDMQPRYSPDGEWIAFTSDRGGGDNVWIARRDGSDPTQVTDEDFRLLNSPVWTPDGDYIAARKHFTSRRSLGAGEIWLYHRSGGEGLMMTKRPDDQKDLGEPAFSPDGRYLYFSQDTTAGKTFQYNKNPHAEIYSIKRLDRQDGRIEVFVSGAGGAIRPTPAPDGRSLLFVRRKGLTTALMLHDVESGAERVLYDGLDRDMQETWAVHGVYPGMAWTPDSAAVVFWAGGKIRRTEIASAETTVIPFRVRDERELRAPVRYPVEVHPERFRTRMLRWVTVAPDGTEVVFQALGHLWIRSLPDGEARRLTADDDMFEQHPSFSRDGRSIVYTTWNDRELGAVRVVARAGGASRVVTERPGHYVEPIFTPSGDQIVYRRVGADRLRAQIWAKETGVWVAPTAGGAATLVSREGSGLHFASDEQRVFFVRTEREDKKTERILSSIDLDGSDRRDHARSEMATEMWVAPDGRWLAFRERYNVFVVAFPATGRVVELGPKMKSMPVAQVSRDGGTYLRWSADSDRLHWSLGSQLFTRELDASFAFLKGADAEEPAPAPEVGLELGIEVASDRPVGVTAFVGGRVITMRGDEVIDDGAVVIDGNRIVAVGARAEVEVPANAALIDTSGMTVLPGLVDVHYHGPQGSSGIIPQQNWSLNAAVAFGVTTAHDPSSGTETFFAAADLQRVGQIVGPRLFSTGTILYGATAEYTAHVENLDDARSHLRRLKQAGAFSVKSYNQPRREQRQQIIAAARELEMMVVPEGGSLWHHNMTMVVDGHTGIEHALPIAAGYQDMVQLWSATDVGYTPTIGVGYGGLSGELYWYQESDVFAHPLLTQHVPPFVLDARARRRLTASAGDWNHVWIARLAKQLADAGVIVTVGAHGQREGLAAHWEMWMLAQGGMSSLEAIRAATLSGAHYIGLERDVGSIEPGKLADLFVVDGDVLADLRRSEQVLYSMVNGRLFDSRTMNELGPRKRVRPPYHWQTDAVD